MRPDGSVACWGDDPNDEATPPEGEFASVSAGYNHTCGVRTGGSVACWGYVRGTPPQGEFASVSAGDHGDGDPTCGVRTDGSVACWGKRSAAPPLGKFTWVSAGVDHVCVHASGVHRECSGEPR